jgi:hypothetical protein
MRKWIVIAAACCIGAVSLASNDPIPGTPGKAAGPQQKAGDKKKPTQSNQRGTEDAPLFVQIKDAPKTQPQSSEDSAQHRDKPPFVWGMTAEENTAIATYALVVVGALTAVVLICQSILLRQTVTGARSEFLASHGPRITLRSASVIEVPAPGGHIHYNILYVLHNTGRVPTRLILSEVAARVLGVNEDRMPLPVAGNQLGSVDFDAGEERSFTAIVKSPTDTILRMNGLRKLAQHDQRLYFSVSLRYGDGSGNTWVSYITREYDGPTDSFRRTENPDDEYTG